MYRNSGRDLHDAVTTIQSLPVVSSKGALTAPFVFAALSLTAAGSVIASPSLWSAALVFVASAIACQRRSLMLRPSPIAFAVAGYAIWLVGNVVLNNSYTPAGLFHPMFIAGGFLLARGLDGRARGQTIALLAGGAVFLAFWALWQAASGEGRAHAHFETPNTLAALLNLMLAPALFMIAHGKGRGWLTVFAIAMTAGLVVTLSRGGFISLAAGLLGTMLLFGVRPQRSGVARLCAALICGSLIGALALSAPRWLAAGQSSAAVQLGDVATTFGPSTMSRAELYRLALSNLGEKPWFGTGYLGFQPLLEAHRAEVPSYATENITYFVHDDYLQTLMELGVPGALLLLALVLFPFWEAKRANAAGKDRLALFAALAGLATMAIHAFGDFPFYVPICLFVFGLLLGEVDMQVAREDTSPIVWRGPAARLSAFAAAVVLAVLYVRPPLAELAAWYGAYSWREGKSERAAYGLELARRLQARDWRYHWYAGQFWYDQAAAGNRRAARLADRAFAAAIAANPQQPQPLLARLATQIRFAALLNEPQPVAILRQWADRALALAPLNPAVRRDYTAALEQLSGRR